MKYLSYAILITTIVYLQACSKGATDPLIIPVDPIIRTSDGWTRNLNTSTDRSVTLKTDKMPEEQQNTFRQQYRQTDLIQIPIDSKYNVALFKIKNVQEWENTIFLAPKLFAYSSSQGARIAPERNEDGTISLPFPVILTDGSTSVIQDPSASSTINLPSTIAISDYSSLKTELKARFDQSQTLSPLPGCPKKIIVKVNDKEYDATPKDLASGDFCQLNTPFNVALRIPEPAARYILEKALYANDVEVRAVYETRVPFTVARMTIEFDKSKLFQELEAEIKINGGYFFNADLHSTVTNIVKKQALKIQIQGDLNAHMETIVDQVIKEFFEPFHPDPKTGVSSCTDATVCVRLNYNHTSESTVFSASWEQSTTAITGQNYITWTKLSALQDRVIEIGNSPLHPELRNNGSSIETGLTVAPGDLLEITPSYLVKEERSINAPVTTRTENIVCLGGSIPIMKMKCYGGGGHDSGGDNCESVHVGTNCIQPQDHWIETTVYNLSSPVMNKVNQPVGAFQELFDGLYLKFTWRNNGDSGDGNAREQICPINLFSREGNGKSMMIRLENQPGCNIFSGNSKEKPMIHLLNRIGSPIKYKTGNYTLKWDGTVTEAPIEAVYTPIIDFAGKISIKGYDFGSYYYGGQKI